MTIIKRRVEVTVDTDPSGCNGCTDREPKNVIVLEFRGIYVRLCDACRRELISKMLPVVEGLPR